MPIFLEPINNATVVIGRDVTLTCVVDHVGSFQVCHNTIFNNKRGPVIFLKRPNNDLPSTIASNISKTIPYKIMYQHHQSSSNLVSLNFGTNVSVSSTKTETTNCVKRRPRRKEASVG